MKLIPMFRHLDLCLLIKHVRLCCVLQGEHLLERQRANPTSLLGSGGITAIIWERENRSTSPPPTLRKHLKLEKKHQYIVCVI